jgi:tRNA nucleotidyltransferase (CCA-adding enzyme)
MTLPFKTYLVGGAVRDELLRRPIKERDWVVIGAKPEELLAQGFQQVGKHFPVFLHPKTREEYALARKEIKTAPGYQGFDFDTSPSISLEEDLKRRDLTINAMAIDETGALFDPYHGKKDLEKKILRHVSEAFIEDPVRILRLARFAARFPDFTVAPETNTLMNKMVIQGEVDALVPQRVWKEWQQALTEKHVEKFYEVLARCHALEKILPPLALHFQVPYEKSALYQLSCITQTSTHPRIRFAVAMSLLTPEALRTFHPLIPREYLQLSVLTQNYSEKILSPNLLPPPAQLDLLMETDAFRREERFLELLEVVQYLYIYQTHKTTDCKNLNALKDALLAAKKISISELLKEEKIRTESCGPNIAKYIYEARLKAIMSDA